ncbi:glycosyltransferase [uncultured Ilyobacter sp.]|uniref:glycosyltransferase n=1 Tax=uncultured Ilyobacter sp. TaxID=544433 RepID=UPI0029C03122|nr:glycosyltransferase [uncultured Ilyobacter sp.]
MIKVYFEKERIYWKKLTESKFEKVNFENNKKVELKKIKELNFKMKAKKLLEKKLFFVIKLKRFIQKHKYRISCFTIKNENDFDFIITKRKVFKGKKPYAFYIENFHSIFDNVKSRNNKIVIKKLEKIFSGKNFKGFIFMSEFSRKVFFNMHKDSFKKIDIQKLDKGVIYTYVEDIDIDEEEYKNSKITSLDNKVKLLYVCSVFELKAGKEVLKAFMNLSKRFELTIITNPETIGDVELEIIKNNKNIVLLEHNMNFEQMKKIYLDTHIIIQPTFMDSAAVAVLEGMKFRVPVISTSTFAVNEYIEDGFNGILLDNPYNCYTLDGQVYLDRYFDDRDFILKITKNHINSNFVKLISQSIIEMVKNYEMYLNNCFKYYNENYYKFGEKAIKEKWEETIKEML